MTQDTSEDGRSVETIFRRVVPILRMFDVGKPREFCVDYLGLAVDWELRFSDDAPLYMQVSRGDLVLYLSEHHRDGTPGSAVYVETSGLRFYRGRHAQATAWSTRVARLLPSTVPLGRFGSRRHDGQEGRS